MNSVSIKLPHLIAYRDFQNNDLFRGVPSTWVSDTIKKANELGLKNKRITKILYIPNHPIGEHCDTVILEYE